MKPYQHLLATTALTLMACTVTQRQAAFLESDFAWSRGSGSGAVTGREIQYNDDGARSDSFYPNTTVSLAPVNAYTTEIIHATYDRAGVLTPGPDPRYASYVRTTRTDGQGRFGFQNLPAGNYYAMATAKLYHAEDNTWYSTPLYARVSVQNGQVTHVSRWKTISQYDIDLRL